MYVKRKTSESIAVNGQSHVKSIHIYEQIWLESGRWMKIRDQQSDNNLSAILFVHQGGESHYKLIDHN